MFLTTPLHAELLGQPQSDTCLHPLVSSIMAASLPFQPFTEGTPHQLQDLFFTELGVLPICRATNQGLRAGALVVEPRAFPKVHFWNAF